MFIVDLCVSTEELAERLEIMAKLGRVMEIKAERLSKNLKEVSEPYSPFNKRAAGKFTEELYEVVDIAVKIGTFGEAM